MSRRRADGRLGAAWGARARGGEVRIGRVAAAGAAALDQLLGSAGYDYFLRHHGRVLTRPMIAHHVWGLDFDPESRIVDVYVGYLRREIDGEGGRRLVHTVRGAGYKLAAEA